MPSVLESNCQPSTGASRLSPTQPFSERLPTDDCPPYDCLLLTKIPLKYYLLFYDSSGKHLIR
ncbi:MAG: hypothetical protein LBL62_08750 [Planctomycetaceae bacterium]|nr:hypothetical protein [Planctomycetaceae bacterium]